MLHGVREVGFLAPFPDLRPKEFAAVCCGIACSKAERLLRRGFGLITAEFNQNPCLLSLYLFVGMHIFNSGTIVENIFWRSGASCVFFYLVCWSLLSSLTLIMKCVKAFHCFIHILCALWWEKSQHM